MRKRHVGARKRECNKRARKREEGRKAVAEELSGLHFSSDRTLAKGRASPQGVLSDSEWRPSALNSRWQSNTTTSTHEEDERFYLWYLARYDEKLFTSFEPLAHGNTGWKWW